MKTTQHTPGPWRIGDFWHTIFGPKSDQPAPVVIAELSGPTPRVSANERRANALLISLAPEMARIMESVVLWDMSKNIGRKKPAPLYEHIVAEARAVLAKLEGGQHD